MFFNQRLWQNRWDAVRFYYKSPKFALIDMTFGMIALFVNPYRLCRKFLQKKGEKSVHTYGETPYTTYEKIVRECGIGPNDIWIELGSGRGKGCFWLSHFVGCKVIGIEQIPQFTWIANAISFLFGMKKVTFRRESVEQADLSQATVVYSYGLYPQITLNQGIKIITTGEPLDPHQIIKTFWIRFPWGRTTAYLQNSINTIPKR